MNSRSLFYRRFAFLFATLLAVTAFGVAQELPTPQQLIQISNTATDLSLTGPYRSCFDPASKLAVSNETKGPGGSHTTWFSDYHEFAGKQYPAAVHAARGQKAFFDVLDISVKPMQFETSHFTPLPDSLEFRTCRDVQPARLESTVPPEYPPLARGAQLRGTVEVFGIIGTDGKLAHLRALSGHPVLAQAALDTLQRWKYVPASCPDGPVATETKIEIEFGFGPASGPGH